MQQNLVAHKSGSDSDSSDGVDGAPAWYRQPSILAMIAVAVLVGLLAGAGSRLAPARSLMRGGDGAAPLAAAAQQAPAPPLALATTGAQSAPPPAAALPAAQAAAAAPAVALPAAQAAAAPAVALPAAGVAAAAPAVALPVVQPAAAAPAAALPAVQPTAQPRQKAWGNWGHMAMWSSKTVRASRICIENKGDMVLAFTMWNMYNNWFSKFTDPFAGGLTTCLDIADIKEVGVDDPIAPRLYASGSWRTQVAFQSIIYDPKAGEATYACTGAVGKWKCDRETPGSLDEAAPPHKDGHPGGVGAEKGHWGGGMNRWHNNLVFADTICVYNKGGYVLKYDIWDGRTNWVTEIGSEDEETEDEHNVVAGHHKCTPIADIGNVKENDPVAPRVNVLGFGDYEMMVSFQSVLYQPNAGPAMYNCAGSFEDWYCNLITHY